MSQRGDDHDPHGEDGFFAAPPPSEGTADEHAAYDSEDGYEDEAPPPRRRRRRGRGCLPVLVAIVVVLVLVVVGGAFAIGRIKDRFQGTADYAGPGTGQLVFQVAEGDTSSDIGRSLRTKGVTESVQAFLDAARADDASRDIQVGYYRLKKQMRAKDALGVLVDPKNLIQSLVTVTEGARVADITARIVDRTDITRAAVRAALAEPGTIGLPAAANGNPEGYLYPATYTVVPGETATQLLTQMVAKTTATEQDLDIAAKAQRLGLSTEQVLTVASILEYEANRKVDYPKVARVIYNRIQQGMPLQLDSTVAYVSKRKGDVYTTAQERASSSPYNTYRRTGLPPGPIGSPGAETLEAALNPAKGTWLYFVPDLEEGTTHFSTTLAEHQKYVDKLAAFCRKSPKC